MAVDAFFIGSFKALVNLEFEPRVKKQSTWWGFGCEQAPKYDYK